MSLFVKYEIRTLSLNTPMADDFQVIEVLNVRPDAGTFRALGRTINVPDTQLFSGPYSSPIINDESVATAGEEEE